jgi:hypothetical protein
VRGLYEVERRHQKDSFPLPRIDDTLGTLAGAKRFPTLDLKSGYWQVDLHSNDKEKTVFSIVQELWQLMIMLLDPCTVPATFERLTESVLSGLTYDV